MQITNKHGLPEQFVRVAENDKYTRGESDISVTTLIDSPRINVLSERHDADMKKDVTEATFSMLGTAVHQILEESQAKPDEVYEERLYATVLGWVMSGAIDVQKYNRNGSITIMDYKVCTAWAVMNDKPEWENQLNCYAWLVQKNKQIPVEKIQVVAVIRDFNRRKAQRERGYPATNIKVIDVPLWTYEEQSSYINTRVLLHKGSQEDFINPLPLCTDQERWGRPAKWAVMKTGRKSAVKLFDSSREAELFINNQKGANALSIEERPSEFTRCVDNFCGVSQFCDQYEGDKAWQML